MTPKQYREAVDRMGWSILEAGRQLGVGARTSQRYAGGETRIPKAVDLLLRILNQYDIDLDAL